MFADAITEEADRERWDLELFAPLPGGAERPVSAEQVEDEMAAFTSFAQQASSIGGAG